MYNDVLPSSTPTHRVCTHSCSPHAITQLKGAKPPALASKDKNARDKAAKRAAVAQHKEDDAAHDAAMAEAESDEDEELVEA